jgi:hypothetical protein
VMFLEITLLAVGAIQVRQKEQDKWAWQTRKDSFSNIEVRFPIWRNILSSKRTRFRESKEKVIVA